MSTTVTHPVFARVYARLSPLMDAAGEARYRDELLDGLIGRIIEVGAGNGLNFSRYPEGVSEVVAVEPEAYLRGRAMEAARRAAVPVTVVDGTADALPAEDASFDVAVASLVLCSVPDQSAALAELYRVLRPGGELRFYEHVISHRPRAAALEDRLDERNVWPRIFGGCHVARDTVGAIQAAGFVIERRRRVANGVSHVLGVARRP